MFIHRIGPNTPNFGWFLFYESADLTHNKLPSKMSTIFVFHMINPKSEECQVH